MIFRLARLQIQSHRLRTIFIAVAAVLTSILYMTVISISYCILDSTQLSRMLATGSDFTRLFQTQVIQSPERRCAVKSKTRPWFRKRFSWG